MYYGYISLKRVRWLDSTSVFVSSVLCNKFKLESALEHRMDKNCVVMKIRMYFFKIQSVDWNTMLPETFEYLKGGF